MSRLGNNPLAKKRKIEEHVVRVMYRRRIGVKKTTSKTKPPMKANSKVRPKQKAKAAKKR